MSIPQIQQTMIMNARIGRFSLRTMVVLVLLSSAGPVMGQEVAREVGLEQALQMARQHSPSLEQSASALEIAQAGQLSALGGFFADIESRLQL